MGKDGEHKGRGLRGCGKEKGEILEEVVFYEGGKKGKRSKEEREGED